MEFQFDGHEVYVTRDEATVDVVLSERPVRGCGEISSR
jgi:hypothetical protein